MPTSPWVVSSYCNEEESACLEARTVPHGVEVRDSTDHGRPRIAFGVGAWTAFLEGYSITDA
ncbi:DUF397 domain-containing protein [Streptomyces daliensis]|uniref:DUF397 domain-containing protein n=1 Tax=Streptomyces daliensis TaxID=299421 RepID=A0A8T4IV25_9ACTN|nr:DUF397 domain-containing protein [Streptomyces daliensis]